jgi:transposase
MVNALAIKRSMGIIRGKNDKADARVIAQYAVRFSGTTYKNLNYPQKAFNGLKSNFLSVKEWLISNVK